VERYNRILAEELPYAASGRSKPKVLLVAAVQRQNMPDQGVLDLVRGSLLTGLRADTNNGAEEARETR